MAIVGWATYFRKANTWLGDYKHLDGWIRRKLRCYRLKQCGRKYTQFKLLRELGIAENSAWNAVLYSQGWWELSNRLAVKLALDNQWFAQKL
mgnify:FL=1